MSTTYRVLAQSAPAATTPVTIYTAPVAVQTIVSSLIVCNRSPKEASFRVWVAPGGAVTADSQYIYYDVPIPGNDTFIATIGITLTQGDQIRVYSGGSGAGFTSFQVYGAEVM